MTERPPMQRAQSVADVSAARKAIEEAKRHHVDASASTKHFKEWLRKVPHQAQDLINAIVSPTSAGSPRIGGRASHAADMQFVPRASQYISSDSLIHAVVYMSRFFASLKENEHAHYLHAQHLMQLFATCMILADKFSNDDAYDDLLPAIGIVTGIQPKVLRRREVEMLSFLMNTSSMFVSESEFESVVFLLEENPWKRLKRDGSMALLCRTAREHTGVEDLHQQLFTADVRRARGPGISAHLKAFSNYLRTNRPRPRLPSIDRKEGGEGKGSFRGRSQSLAPGGRGIFSRVSSFNAGRHSTATSGAASSSASASNEGGGVAGTAGKASSTSGGSFKVRPGFMRSNTTASVGDRVAEVRIKKAATAEPGRAPTQHNSASAPSSPTSNSSARGKFDFFGILSRSSSKGASKGASPVASRRPASPPGAGLSVDEILTAQRLSEAGGAEGAQRRSVADRTSPVPSLPHISEETSGDGKGKTRGPRPAAPAANGRQTQIGARA